MKRKNDDKSSDLSSKKHPKSKRFKPQPKKVKSEIFVQPKLPKCKEDVSSNWIALQKVGKVLYGFNYVCCVIILIIHKNQLVSSELCVKNIRM
jgi:hypothetical protein